MDKTLNNIIRFQGSDVSWRNNISNGTWADAIVYGLVTETATGKVSKRFYAGRNSRDVDYEYKNAITIDSKTAARQYISDDYIGLLITVISETNVNENGTYIVTYNINNNLELLKIGDGGRESTTIYPVIAAKEVGYIKVGDEIPAGKTLQGIVDMIFTKVLGLSANATSPSVEITGITDKAYEVNYLFTNSITLTATYRDGHWNNEDEWKKSGSTYQNFGTSPLTYEFTGMKEVPAQRNNSITINNYVVKKGTQNVTVTVSHTNSMNVPVNQNNESLILGNVNSTTTYAEWPMGSVSATSRTLTGVYRYWIGYTTIEPTNINRSILDDSIFNKEKTDLITTNTITYDPEFTIPKYSYVTIVVPNEFTLSEAYIEAFNVADTFNVCKISNIGLDTEKMYKVYTLKVESADNIKIKKIKLIKN